MHLRGSVVEAIDNGSSASDYEFHFFAIIVNHCKGYVGTAGVVLPVSFDAKQILPQTKGGAGLVLIHSSGGV